MNTHPRIKLIFILCSFCWVNQFLSTVSSFAFSLSANPSTLMDEICNNGIDDDGDGTIDMADSDCQCTSFTIGLGEEMIPNGDFSETNGCCAALASPGFNCLKNWVAIGGSADYVSDNCLSTDLRPDVRVLTNQLNQEFNNGYVHSLFTSGPNRHAAESVGICLNTPMLVGKTYGLSIDIANLRDEVPDEFPITIYGITDCADLANYNPQVGIAAGFCDLGLPVEKLGTFNTSDLENFWKNFTFAIQPSQEIGAIFYAIDCEFPFPTSQLSINLVLNNFSLRKFQQEFVTQFTAYTEISDTISSSMTLDFNGQILSEAGVYRDTLQTTLGCDSIITLDLSIANENPENCNNGMDDDGDGLIDAFDGDCVCLEGQDTILSNKILIDGNPCEGTLRFIIQGADDLPIYWFKDSIPLVRTRGGNLNFNALTIDEANGVYHGKVSFEDSTCQLVGPLYYNGVTIPVSKTLSLCEGTIYQFGNLSISKSGFYEQIFPSDFNGCDTLISLQVSLQAPKSTFIAATITEGETYDFYGKTLTTEGNYQHTLLSKETNCDSIIQLGLKVYVEEICDNKTNEFIATICEGETYPLGDSIYNKSGIYTQTYARSGSDCDSTITLNLEVLPIFSGDTLSITQDLGTSYDFHGLNYEESGIYEANLTSENGCDSLVWLNLSLINPCTNLIEIVAEWADTECENVANGWIELQTINGTPPFQYSIDGGANFVNQSTFTDLSEGEYEVAVLDSKGCLSSNFVTIEAGSSNLSLQLPPDTTLYEGQFFDLEIKVGNFEPKTYNWTSEDVIINCPNCPTIRITPTSSSTITLLVTTENGCQATDEILIEVNPIPKLYIPTAFSPNGDGQNDIFKAEGISEVLARVHEMKIFNRWGELIFQQQPSNDFNFLGWDGTIQNQVATSGVYIYLISWQNAQGQDEVLSGEFTLIR